MKEKIPAKMVSLVRLKMVREKTKRYEGRVVSCPEDTIRLAKDFLGDLDSLDRENFIVIYLNTKNEPNAIEKVSVGSINSSIVHPREVLKTAILSNSTSIICMHNHPSGDSTPSIDDINTTRRLEEASQILGISLLDHIISGKSDYYSFKEHEMIT